MAFQSFKLHNDLTCKFLKVFNVLMLNFFSNLIANTLINDCLMFILFNFFFVKPLYYFYFISTNLNVSSLTFALNKILNRINQLKTIFLFLLQQVPRIRPDQFARARPPSGSHPVSGGPMGRQPVDLGPDLQEGARDVPQEVRRRNSRSSSVHPAKDEVHPVGLAGISVRRWQITF